MTDLPPAPLLQGLALWLLLLALVVSFEEPSKAPAAAAAYGPAPSCPLCGAALVDGPSCWCAADGQWL